MNIRNYILSIALFLVLGAGASAQSRAFELGKWTQIQNAIIKELNRSYVDSLPLARIERAGIDAMLESLDPYTVYIPEEEDEDLQMLISKTYGGIGAVIYKPEKNGPVIINEPYENSAARKFGLECADEILEIDGVSVVGLDSKECSERMRGKPGTDVKFKVRKRWTGDITDITVTRQNIHLPDIEYYGMLDDTTGYILQSGFTEGVAQQIRSAIIDLKSKGCKRLFYDLRGNGGGLLQEAADIVGIFVPKGSLVVEGKGNGAQENMEYRTRQNPLDLELPVVVLVDSGSASASEVVSGALQDYDRATIMGARTFGKGLVQSIRPLPFGGKMKITTAKYYTPSGRCVQAIDYSNRNEDGSVGHIPDSLTHEFKTAHGRIVRDGGGITPDVKLDFRSYNRLTYSLVLNGVIEQYALEYVREHRSIPAVDDFHFTAEDYESFIKFALGKTFDYRSSAKTLFDQMRKELQKDGLEDTMKDELDALDKAIMIDKEKFLRLKMDEVIPFIEEEIAVRYYFQSAGVKIRIRYDDALRQALSAKV